MNWVAILSLFINVFVLVFFILVAVLIFQVIRDKERYPNVVTITLGWLNFLYFGAIVFAFLAFVQVFASLGAIFVPEYFGKEPCTPNKKQYVHYQTMVQPPMPSGQIIAQPAVAQPILVGNAPISAI